MNNDNMMQMMMQMMMQQNQMMTMLMQQMSVQSQQSSSAFSPTVTFESQGEAQNVDAQIADLQRQIESLKVELAAEKQTREAVEKSYQSLQEERKKDLIELSDLKKVVAKAETYLGDSIESVAAKAQELSGDDYYEENKKDWHEKKLTNKEMHDKVTAYKNLFKDKEEDDDGMVIFN